MAFQKICEICGTPFTAEGNRARYCKPCAKKRKQKVRNEYRKRWREAHKPAEPERPIPEEKFFGDTTANILACLACTRTACMLDSQDTCSLLSARR